MPSISREQLQKWTKNLPEGWKFDTHHYMMWNEKEIYTDSDTDPDTGVFYRLELDYKPVYPDRYSAPTGQQLTARIYRYRPTGTGELYTVVGVLDIPQGEPVPRKNYNQLVKIAQTIDTAAAFEQAKEKDPGRDYYTIGA